MLPSPEYHKPLLNKFFEGNFNFSSICWLKGDNFTFWFRPLFIFTLISNLVCKHPPPLWNDLSCGAAPWKHKPSRALSEEKQVAVLKGSARAKWNYLRMITRSPKILLTVFSLIVKNYVCPNKILYWWLINDYLNCLINT